MIRNISTKRLPGKLRKFHREKIKVVVVKEGG